MMNERQLELYNNLMELCTDEKTFFFSDQVLDSSTYRIFNYHLASYSMFLLPDALECRGHTFKIDEDGNPLQLVSWTLEKFFNHHEVSSDINTLCETLITQGRLSRDVYEKAKKQYNK